MDVRSYNVMEALFISKLDFEFHIDQKYYNKYLNSLIAFIQGMQRQLQVSYDQILRVAYEQEEQTEMQEEILV
jgi:hypothetical protein